MSYQRLMRSVWRFFARLVPTGMPVIVMRGPLRGARWIAGAAAGEGKGLSVVLNQAEPDQMERARQLSPRDGICFDVGANVGLYTLLFARYTGHVYAFEPLPRNVQLLSRTVELNGARNVTIVPCAVSDSTGLATFEEGNNWATGKLSSGGKQPVATVSLDHFVSVCQVHPDLVKIDVEGAELAVLEGARHMLASRRPAILLSTHGAAVRDRCLEFVTTLNYSQITPLDARGLPANQASEFLVLP